jgi:hypothetical protein
MEGWEKGEMKSKLPDNALTLAALGILAFVVADVTHEALGHGIAILAFGGKPVLLTSCNIDHSGTINRWIPAAGGIANLVVGFLALVAVRLSRKASPHLRYFFVLAASFNLFFAAGYPIASGIAGFGDWAAVIAGWTPIWAWRLLLIAATLILYWVFLRVVARAIRPFGGSNEPEDISRLRRITVIPYVAAIVAATLAAALNPSRNFGTMLGGIMAAAASFGLTQMDNFPQAGTAKASVPPAGPITRSVPWIVAGAVVLVFFVGVLGRGIRFSPGM